MVNREYDVIIIGGGAAGLMAATTAAGRGRSVLVAEKNRQMGKKLLITGKGRCNITNNCDIDTLMQNIPTNHKFLYSAFRRFGPAETMDFFESRGLSLKTERGNRVFPVSDRSADVLSVLIKACKQCHVDFLEATVEELLLEGNTVKGIACAGSIYHAKSVIVATGGKSYPQTGSSGDGYRFASSVGHTVIPTVPSLVPLVIAEPWCKELQGLSLKNVTLMVRDLDSGKEIYRELGEMLFTHYGISGPLVLSSSAHMKKMRPGKYAVLIDLKPALEEKQLDSRLLRDFEKYKNRDFSNALDDLLPQKLIPVMIRLSGIAPDKKVNQLSKEERKRLISLCKGMPMTVERFRPIEEAIITSGGVNISEINPKTMESKLCSGLFFSGEVLDVDAYTGGFNLQIAFSTGYLAGCNA